MSGERHDEGDCDRSAVCLAYQHESSCRSQMSSAGLDAFERRVSSCTCEPLLSQEGVCRVHDPVAASFIESILPRLLDEFDADKAAGRLSGRNLRAHWKYLNRRTFFADLLRGRGLWR